MFRNRLFYFFVVLCALVYLYFTGDRLASLLVYSLLLLPALSLLCLLLAVPFVKVDGSLSGEYAVKGERFALLVSVRNRGPFYLPAAQLTFYQNEIAYEQPFAADALSLLPGRKKELMLENRCLYAGSFEAGVMGLRLTDFCGFFSLTLRKTPLTLQVCPQTSPILLPAFGMSRLSDADSGLLQQREDLCELYGVREYQPGDAPKRIHWKLTAKTGALLVRRYNRAAENGCMILMDPQRSQDIDAKRIPLQDRLLQCAASLASACLARRMPAKLLLYQDGVSTVEIGSEEDLALARRLLARSQFSPELRLSDMLSLFMEQLGDGRSVMLVTFTLDEPLCGQAYALREQGSEVLIYLVESGSDVSGEIVRRLSEAGVAVYRQRADEPAGPFVLEDPEEETA